MSQDESKIRDQKWLITLSFTSKNKSDFRYNYISEIKSNFGDLKKSHTAKEDSEIKMHFRYQ